MADPRDVAIGLGILGMGPMGRAHSSAFRRIAQVRAGAEPRLTALACRSAETGQAFAARCGFMAWRERWEDLIAGERIALFDNTGPNGLHAEPCMAAARAGKHVLCEKPLARNATEAYRVLDSACSRVPLPSAWLGDVNWRRVKSAVVAIGHDYALSFEQEKPVMSTEDGLEKTIEYLRPLMVKKPLTQAWW